MFSKTRLWKESISHEPRSAVACSARRFTIADFQSSELGTEYLSLARKLARLPRPSEFPRFSALSERFGSPQRIRRLASAVLDPAELESIRRQKREEFLIYYGAMRLQGLRVPRASLLPDETQADIRSIWPSYRAARVEGERFLFSMGDPEQTASAVKSAPVGKLVVDALYAHRSTEEQLPALNRLQLFAARQIVGELEYDVLKLSADGQKISFLRYPGFDKYAHPGLQSSLVVYLPKADYSFRDFSHSRKPADSASQGRFSRRNVSTASEVCVPVTPGREAFAALTTRHRAQSRLGKGPAPNRPGGSGAPPVSTET